MYKFWPAFANNKKKSFKIHTIPTYYNPTQSKQNPTQTKVNEQDEIGKKQNVLIVFMFLVIRNRKES